MEKILTIKEISEFKLNEVNNAEYTGYFIETDKTEIFLLVEDGTHCCENFGFMTTENDINEFIGEEIQSEFKITALRGDEEYDTVVKAFKDFNADGYYSDVTEAIFLEFMSKDKTLQFAVYNTHNGYYGHDIRILIKDKTSDIDEWQSISNIDIVENLLN